MKKILLSCVCFAFFFPVIMHGLLAAEENVQKKKDNKNAEDAAIQDKSAMKVVKKTIYNAALINSTLKEFTDKLKSDNKGDTHLLPTDYMIFVSQLEMFYKYPNVELEALVYRIWYKKLYDAVVGMCTVRRYEDAALAMHQKEKAEKYKEDYKKYFNDFKNLIVNKKKFEIPDDKLREMQKKKDKAEEEAHKKRRR